MISKRRQNFIQSIIDSEYDYNKYAKLHKKKYREEIEYIILERINNNLIDIHTYALVYAISRIRDELSIPVLIKSLDLNKNRDKRLVVEVMEAIGDTLGSYLKDQKKVKYISEIINKVREVIKEKYADEVLSKIAWVLSNTNKKFKNIDLMNQTKESLMKVLEDPMFNN